MTDHGNKFIKPESIGLASANISNTILSQLQAEGLIGYQSVLILNLKKEYHILKTQNPNISNDEKCCR
jgi:hypothetical protein